MNVPTGSASGGAQYPYEVAYKMDYAVDLEIVTYQDDGSDSIHLVLREAYPIYVGNEIGLSWKHRNGYIQIPVNMAYTDWRLYRSAVAPSQQSAFTGGLAVSTNPDSVAPSLPFFASGLGDIPILF